MSSLITVHPMNETVLAVNGNFNLSCEATGFPAPSITWSQNGIVINSSTEDRRVITERTLNLTTMSTLTVGVAVLDDSGTYSCRTSNDVGEPDTVNVSVIVQSKSQI